MHIKIGYRKPGVLMGKSCGFNGEEMSKFV